MDLGSNFVAKLEPYLLMGKSMKGAAAAKLIQDATSAPGVFVFGELFELPGIRDLEKNEQHSKSYKLLQLFAYKTYWDYLENRDQLPALNEAQTIKLKHLSIVSMATERRILPYPQLMSSLAMSTIRDLEDLIIDAIYLDILRGKLDQKESQLEVEYTMGRDLEPGKVEAMLNALRDWASTTSAVLATLDSQISTISAQTDFDQKQKEDYEVHVQQIIKEVNDKKESNSSYPLSSGTRRLQGQNTTGSGDRMDVDEPEVQGLVSGGSKGKNRKAPQAEAKPSRKRNRF
ncbi:uncharacterized protein C8R40DRAFT_1157847 [Lentinula edodes]|uniref:uncharacterized protein n=1 Tax=Lentinula edodes TaxID=5353 RepID=UPI001E8E78B0|nr:uncharacterized protein C8R40DRAFT_1157847 [Lentinula edodes]KAH7881620.1 hypothetical protein C8R40DRAFT_1157847 [Lentinula edodes]